jgi:hypothetical protein
MNYIYGNVITNERTNTRPTSIGGWQNPPESEYRRVGYRLTAQEDTPAEGYRATGWRVDDIDGETCHAVITSSVNIAEEEAAAAEAARTPASFPAGIEVPFVVLQSRDAKMGYEVLVDDDGNLFLALDHASPRPPEAELESRRVAAKAKRKADKKKAKDNRDALSAMQFDAFNGQQKQQLRALADAVSAALEALNA